VTVFYFATITCLKVDWLKIKSIFEWKNFNFSHFVSKNKTIYNSKTIQLNAHNSRSAVVCASSFAPSLVPLVGSSLPWVQIFRLCSLEDSSPALDQVDCHKNHTYVVCSQKNLIIILNKISFVGVHIAETVHCSLRGSLAAFQSLFVFLGMLIVLGLGYCFHDWRTIAWICMIPGCIHFIMIFFLHETPYWLMDHNRKEEAMWVK